MIFDYETFSEANLKAVGAYEYSLHPSTEILCVAYRIGTLEELPKVKTKKWVPSFEELSSPKAFSDLLAALRNPLIHIVARNAMFEMLITKHVFGRKLMPSKPELQAIPVERWTCTAAQSRALGLPGSLEGTGAALNLEFQKDKGGHEG